MLKNLSTQKLLIIGAAGLVLFRDEAAELLPGVIPPSGPALIPGAGYGQQRQGLNADPTQPEYGIDAGTRPERHERAVSGAVDWRPGHDVLSVQAVPHYAVRGCCGAWATAFPAPDGRTQRGAQRHPNSKKSRACGCTVPGRDAGRSWWQPWKRANRKFRNVPDVEFAPGDTDWSGGTEDGQRVKVRGFVHDGIAWIVSTQTRNFKALTDANRDVVYLVSTMGRVAYNAREGRQLEAHEWRMQYKGRDIEPNANPWAVDPWHTWAHRGWPRGGMPSLQASEVSSVPGYRHDFVAPVYAWALARKPIVRLPLREGRKVKGIASPKRSGRTQKTVSRKKGAA